MKHAICRTAAVVMLAACLLTGCGRGETYKFGKDQIPGIGAVVGERSLVSTTSQGKNEFPGKEYKYQSLSAVEDLTQYVAYLENDGWVRSGDSDDLQNPPGIVKLVKPSVEADHLLVMEISFASNQYTIAVNQVEAILSQP